jgi:hypothetical protein
MLTATLEKFEDSARKSLRKAALLQGCGAFFAVCATLMQLMPAAAAIVAVAAFFLSVLVAIGERWSWKASLGLIPAYPLSPIIQVMLMPPATNEGNANAAAALVGCALFAGVGGLVLLYWLRTGRSAVKRSSSSSLP